MAQRTKQTLTVPIELMPEETPLSAAKETASDAAETPDNGESLNIIGFTVKEISPELAERYKLAPSTSGVVVTDILPNSDASRKGIKSAILSLKSTNATSSAKARFMNMSTMPGAKTTVRSYWPFRDRKPFTL